MEITRIFDLLPYYKDNFRAKDDAVAGKVDGEWVKYSSPDPGGAQYVAICIPAFSVDAVNRD